MPTAPEKSAATQSWLRRSLRWLLKGALVVVLLLVFLVVGDYVYEAWSGARAWAKAKAGLQAAGISLDPNTYIPLPVPDAENFAALPIFQPEPDPKSKGAISMLALYRAFALFNDSYTSYGEDYKPGKLPKLGIWNQGEKPDIAVVEKQLKDCCQHASPPIPVPDHATASEMFSLICPALANLRAANAIRPSCWFKVSYSTPVVSTMEPILSQVEVAKVLSYEEQLALQDGQASLSLKDFGVDWKILSGLQKVPLLIVGLINEGVLSIHLKVLNQGLASHAWTDQQLAQLDSDLGTIDFLTACQLCIRGDFAAYKLPQVDRYKADSSAIVRDYLEAVKQYGQVPDPKEYRYIWVKAYLSSRGVWDKYLASFAPLLLPGRLQLIDLPSRRIFPEKEMNFSITLPEVDRNWIESVKKFAFGQIQVDEARIACRLERYRLAHGAYPDSLAKLTDGYGELPHDIMNGDAYHYKLNADETYMLYSVGWNQKDDGGNAGYFNHGTHSPDWTWTNYPDYKKPEEDVERKRGTGGRNY